jgi:hypothetical protein
MSEKLWATPKGTDGERGGRGDLLAMARGYQMAHNGTLPNDSIQLTLFAEAFPASRTLSLVDGPVPTMSATSGPSSCDSFASVNPDGSWRKTSQGYCQVMLDGSLEPFSETWPRAGMTRNGIAYQLRPLAPLTDATASGSWPTPCAEDAKNVPYQKGKGGQRYPMLLGAVAPERMWPTPTSRDHKDGSAQACANVPVNCLLGRAVHWRTPQARDGQERGASSPETREEQGHSVSLHDQVGGQLNPTWVEWLMGYPLGWTACAAWATRSSRRSPNGSRAASSPPKRT